MTVTRDSAPAEPREGLPPCLSFVIFDGRVACLAAPCKSCEREGWRVQIGDAGRRVAYSPHPGTYSLTAKKRQQLDFDDPAEAQAAFERGAEWVRTGEGP